MVGADAGAPSSGETLRHEFPPVDVASGEEVSWLCQSWTLDNDEPLWVREVRSSNDGAWHHSNWFFVRDSMYSGPDGTWDCGERDFSEPGAALAGGVFFAQSTQATEEAQRFPEGAAIKLPAHARILGDIHLLNVTGEDKSTAIRFEVETMPEEEAETHLAPMSFTNVALELPPRQQSHFSMECDLESHLAAPADFGFYYVLPHYHDLGTLLRLEAVGGPNDGEVLFETRGEVGEPLGQAFDPPRSLDGATGLRLTCGFDNPRDEVVRYGIGDQEMCVFLAFTDSRKRFAAIADENTPVGESDGIALNESNCRLGSFTNR